MNFFVNVLKAGKNFFKIILVLLMIFIFVLSGGLFYYYPKIIKPLIFKKITEEIPKQVALNTNAKLEVGNVYGDLISYLALNDLKLKDAKTSKVYLTIREVVIKYNLKNYFIYKEPGAILDIVEIRGLKVFVERDKKGVINLTKIAKPAKKVEKKPPPFFRVKVFIPNAYIKYTDYYKESDDNPFIEDLKNANIYFNADAFPLLFVKIKATPKEKKNIEIAAKINLKKESVSVRGNLPEKNLVPLIAHFVKNNEFKLLSGKVSAQFQLYSKFDFKDPILIADTKVSSLKLTVKKAPVKIEDCKIEASISSDIILLKRADVKLTGGEAHLAGIIYDFKNPQIGIDAILAVKSFSPFKKFFPPKLKNLQGQVNLRAVASGDAKNPLVEGEVALGKTSILKQDIKGAQARFRYFNKNVEILSLVTSTNIGDLQAAGIVNFAKKKPKFSLTLATSKINLENLSTLLNMPIDGTAEGILALSFASPLKALGRVNVADISSLYGFDVQKLGASFLLNGNNLILKTGNLITSGAKVYLAGEGDYLNKKFKADYETSLDLENIFPLQGVGDVKGKVFISGRGSGDLKNPNATANIFGGEGYFKMVGTEDERTLDLLSGKVNLVSSKLFVQNLKLLSDKTNITGRGVLNLKGKQDINMHLDAKEINIEKFLSKPGANNKFKGVLDAVVDIGGTLKDVAASGYVKAGNIFYEANIPKDVKYKEEAKIGIEEGGESEGESEELKTKEKILEQLMTSGEGYLSFKNKELQVNNFFVKKNNSELTLQGKVNLAGKNKNLQLNLLAPDFDLKDLPFVSEYYGKMNGKVELKGSINGSLENPEVNISLVGENIETQNQKIDKISSQINLKDKQGEWKQSFKIGSSLLDVVANILPEEETDEYKITAEAKITHFDLPIILDLTKSSIKEGVNGILDGVINFEGNITKNDKGNLKFKNLHPKVDFIISEANFANNSVKNITGNLEYQNDQIFINKFLIQSEDGMLNAFGRIHTKGDLDFQVQAKNIQLGILQPLIKSKNNLTGALNIILNFTGTAYEPKAYGYATVDNFKYGNKSLDSVKAKVKYYNDIFDLQELLIKLQEQEFKAYGTVPFAWEDKKIPEDGKLNIDAAFSQFDLKLLPSLVSAVDAGDGSCDFKVHIGGTYKKPNLEGNFSIQNGFMKFAALNNPLRDFNVGISFNQNKVIVDNFKGKMGGGNLSLSGNLTLSEFKPQNFDLKFLANNVGMAMPPSLEGNVSADIALGGTYEVPEIKGTIFAKDTNYVLVASEEGEKKEISLTELFASLPEPIPSIIFDLKVSMGDNVWIRNTNMQMKTEGDIKFQGTLPEPNLSGTLTAKTGTIAYFSSLFRLKESYLKFGTQLFSYFPTLDITASTNIEVPDKSDLEKKKKKNIPVDIQLTGTIDKIDTKFVWDKSEFNVPESELITYLGHRASIEEIAKGNVTDVLKSEGTQLLTANLRMHLFDPLEQQVENLLNLSEFRVDYDANKNFQLKIAKEIYPKFTVSLFKVFSQTIKQNISLEYALAPHKNLSYGFTYIRNQENTLNENILALQIKTNFANIKISDLVETVQNTPKSFKEVTIDNLKQFFKNILRIFKREKKKST